MTTRHVLVAFSLGLVIVGCSGDDSGPGHTGEPPGPPDSTTGTTTGTPIDTTDTTSGEMVEQPCGPQQPCPAEEFCAAPHQAGGLEPAGDFVCMPQCIPGGSSSFWCLDDTSCCGDATCDTRFGLCELESTTTTGTETGTTETGTTDATGTGTTDSGTTGTGTTDTGTTDSGTAGD